MKKLNYIILFDETASNNNYLEQLILNTGKINAEIFSLHSVASLCDEMTEKKPEYVLFNTRNDEENDLLVLQKLRQTFPVSQIVLFTTKNNPEFKKRAMKEGPNDFFNKNNPDFNLLKKIALQYNSDTYHKKNKIPDIHIEDLEELINDLFIEGIICINLTGTIVFWNKRAEKIFGWSHEEVIGKDLASIVVQDTKKSIHNAGFKSFLRGEKEYMLENSVTFPSVNAKGQPIDVEMVIRKLKKNNEDIICIFIKDVTDQKKIRKVLERSSERFAMITKTTNDAIWEWDLVTGELLSNENHQLLYGLTMNDPVPSDQVWISRIHPDDRERIVKLQKDAFESDTNVFISEYKFRGEGNDYINVFDRCYIIRDTEGKPIRATGSMMNITESKKAEEKIAASNKRFEFIAKTTNDALWDFDLITNETIANERHQQLYGLTLNDPPPSFETWVQSIHPDDRERVVKSYNEAMESTEKSWVCEYRFVDYKKEVKYIFDRSYILRNNEGRAIRLIGSVMDVSDQRKAELAMLQSEEKYRMLVEQATDGIFIADQTGKFEIVNTAGLKLSQYSLEELKKMTIYDLADSEDLKANPFHFEDMKLEKGSRVERKLKRKDGTVIDIEVNAKFLSDMRFLVFIRDISARKAAEAELNASYKAIRKLTSYLQNVREDERTNIAREIHDELGQALTVLKMDFSWVNKKISHIAEEPVLRRLEDILVMLNETVNTVRRISSDLRPSLLDDLGLAAAIEWQLSEFEKRSGIIVKFESAELKSPSNINKTVSTAFFRILQESLTNIARHSGAKNIDVILELNEDYIELSIKDNGVGFDIDNMNKRTLGLLGMKERAKMIGGDYEIKSIIGNGTTITVRAPNYLLS
jgi:PAS domain S-box-containing protein